MIIDGKKIAQEILDTVAAEISQLDFKPLLCDVLVGDDPVSLSYVRIKQRKAEAVGFGFKLIHLLVDAVESEVIAAITEIGREKTLCGLLVQLPLPKHLNAHEVVSAISQQADVDVLNPDSAQKFYTNKNSVIPPTAGAIVHILDSLSLSLEEKTFIVVGQGELVGKPVTHVLRSRGYSVSVADISTLNLAAAVSTADIVISGVGKAGLITGDMIKPGAIVIDAGTSESGGTISGDVDFESVSPVAGYITPVPGGVGPVTVAMLMLNVINVAKQK